MSARLTHRGAAALGAGLAAAISLFATSAGADATAENYVRVNANQAIASLDATGTPGERSAKFSALMDRFSDINALSNFVLGRYARTLRADPALKEEWTNAFRDYATASYENEFDRYRGLSLTVTGSRDIVQNGEECSRVGSHINEKSGAPMQIYWYLCKAPGGGDWKVADVGVVQGDSEVKLAILQHDQFTHFLDVNGGDVRKLIDRVKQQTALMRARMASKRG